MEEETEEMIIGHPGEPEYHSQPLRSLSSSPLFPFAAVKIFNLGKKRSLFVIPVLPAVKLTLISHPV